MTSVRGHLTELHFPAEYKKWEHPPPDSLFNAPVMTVVSDVGFVWLLSFVRSNPWFVVSVDNTTSNHQDGKHIAKNIEEQARYHDVLFIWTDCDREGEHIGGEVRDAARKGNSQIAIKRARFSNIERG